MDRVSQKIILDGVRALQRSAHEHFASLCEDRARSGATWEMRQALEGYEKDGDGISYDAEEAQKVRAGYDRRVTEALRRVAECEKALDDALALLFG